MNKLYSFIVNALLINTLINVYYLCNRAIRFFITKMVCKCRNIHSARVFLQPRGHLALPHVRDDVATIQATRQCVL